MREKKLTRNSISKILRKFLNGTSEENKKRMDIWLPNKSYNKDVSALAKEMWLSSDGEIMTSIDYYGYAEWANNFNEVPLRWLREIIDELVITKRITLD